MGIFWVDSIPSIALADELPAEIERCRTSYMRDALSKAVGKWSDDARLSPSDSTAGYIACSEAAHRFNLACQTYFESLVQSLGSDEMPTAEDLEFCERSARRAVKSSQLADCEYLADLFGFLCSDLISGSPDDGVDTAENYRQVKFH